MQTVYAGAGGCNAGLCLSQLALQVRFMRLPGTRDAYSNWWRGRIDSDYMTRQTWASARSKNHYFPNDFD